MNRLFTLIFLLSSAIGFSGPWVPVLGGGYAQFSATPMWYSSAHGTDMQMNVVDNTYQYYMEYGIGKSWGLKTIVPFKSIRSAYYSGDRLSFHPINAYPLEGELKGLGNSIIEISRSLRQYPSGYYRKRKLDYSVGCALMLPPTNVDIPKELYPGFNALGVKPKVSIGRSGGDHYRYVDVGYLMLSNGYADLFQLEAEYGLTIRNRGLREYREYGTKLLVAISLNTSVPVGDISNADYKSESTVLYSNTAGYVCPGIKGIYQLNNGLEFNTAIFGAVWGRLVAAVPSVTVGVGYKWKRSIRGVTPETVWE